MALTPEQLDALERAPFRDDGLMFEPTLAGSVYRPLLVLGLASVADLEAYGRGRGWSDLAIGQLIGAVRLIEMMSLVGGEQWAGELWRQPETES